MQALPRVDPENQRQTKVMPERLTKTRRHTDECRRRLEKLTRDVRLHLRDIRLNRDTECEKETRQEEMEVHELMGDTETAGDFVAEGLLKDGKNLVDAETCEERTSYANREDADKEPDESKRTSSGKDYSCWGQREDSWKHFANVASAVRPDTI